MVLAIESCTGEEELRFTPVIGLELSVPGRRCRSHSWVFEVQARGMGLAFRGMQLVLQAARPEMAREGIQTETRTGLGAGRREETSRGDQEGTHRQVLGAS